MTAISVNRLRMPWEGDDRILGVVRSLCQQLNISNYNPTNITWRSDVDTGGWFNLYRNAAYYRYRPLPYDECVLAENTVILPEDMRERLEPEEWRPIIASALFYKKTLLVRRVTGITMRTVIMIVAAVALFVALPILLPQSVTMVDRYGAAHTNPAGWVIASVVGPLLVIVGSFVLGLLYLRWVRLLADRDASNIVGAPAFLAVLNKIAGLDTNGNGRTSNRRGAGVRYLPAIGQRIANLQKLSS